MSEKSAAPVTAATPEAPQAEAPAEANEVQYPLKSYSKTQQTRQEPKKTSRNKAQRAAEAMRQAEADEKKAEPKEAKPAEKVAKTPEKAEPKEAKAPEAVEPVKAPEKAEETKEAKKPDEQDARFRALYKAEKRFQEKSKSDKESLEKERETFQTEVAQHNESLKEAQAIQKIMNSGDKYALINHLGLDVKEWARHQLGQPEPAKTQSVESQEVSELREQITAMQTAQREREEAATRADEQTQANAKYETVKGNYLDRIGELVKNEPQRYKYIRAKEAAANVWNLIEQNWHDTGSEMSVEEASDILEAYFDKEAESYRIATPEETTPQGEARAEEVPAVNRSKKTQTSKAAPNRIPRNSGLTASERKAARREQFTQNL